MLTAINQGKDENIGYHPSYDPDDLTVNTAANALTDMGYTNFIIKADTKFNSLLERISKLRDEQQASTPDIPLLDLINE